MTRESAGQMTRLFAALAAVPAMFAADGCGNVPDSRTFVHVVAHDGGADASQHEASAGRSLPGRDSDAQSGTQNGGTVGSHSSRSSSGGAIGSSGGAPGSSGGTANSGGVTVDACTVVTHTNGIGQTWHDCVPLRTYDEQQATKACVAYTGDPKACQRAPGCGTAPWIIQGLREPNDPNDYIWGYAGNTAGYVGAMGACPSSGGKEWD